MHIIIRASGERTEKRCIELARNQGTVHIIRAHPFGESIRQTYKLAIKLNQEWIPVVDADVLLLPGTLKKAIHELEKLRINVFCLDGKTKDKIFMSVRRAGIHIYKTSLLHEAIKFIDYNYIKPETRVRTKMKNLGYPTYVGKIVFGYHDYEQYYRDLWRKAVCQVYKLNRRMGGMRQRWKLAAQRDKDYQVILAGNAYGRTVPKDSVIIDKNRNFNAEENLRKMGIREKGVL